MGNWLVTHSTPGQPRAINGPFRNRDAAVSFCEQIPHGKKIRVMHKTRRRGLPFVETFEFIESTKTLNLLPAQVNKRQLRIF